MTLSALAATFGAHNEMHISKNRLSKYVLGGRWWGGGGWSDEKICGSLMRSRKLSISITHIKYVRLACLAVTCWYLNERTSDDGDVQPCGCDEVGIDESYWQPAA